MRLRTQINALENLGFREIIINEIESRLQALEKAASSLEEYGESLLVVYWPYISLYDLWAKIEMIIRRPGEIYIKPGFLMYQEALPTKTYLLAGIKSFTGFLGYKEMIDSGYKPFNEAELINLLLHKPEIMRQLPIIAAGSYHEEIKMAAKKRPVYKHPCLTLNSAGGPDLRWRDDDYQPAELTYWGYKERTIPFLPHEKDKIKQGPPK